MNRRSFIKGLALVPCLGFLKGKDTDVLLPVDDSSYTVLNKGHFTKTDFGLLVELVRPEGASEVRLEHSTDRNFKQYEVLVSLPAPYWRFVGTLPESYNKGYLRVNAIF